MIDDGGLLNKHKKLIIIVLMLCIVIAVIIPLYRQAIMCNDELQTRYWAGLGLETFFNHYFEIWKEQGRILAAPISSVTMYLGFLSIEGHYFRIAQIAVLLIGALAFGYLIKTIFGDTRFAILCAITSLVLIPVSFENTLPNAFVTFIGIPMIMVLLSMSLFIKYVDNGGNFLLIVSMILLFVSEIIYEAFVTLMPIYCLLAIYRNKQNNERPLKSVQWPVIAGFLFLIIYFAMSKLFPTNYTGNSFARPFDIFNSIEVIKTFFIGSLPGFYIFNPKYSYIMTTMAVDHSIGFTIRTIVLLSAFILLLIVLFRQKDEKTEKISWGKYLIPIITGLLVSVFPYIPLSLSELYQSTAGSSFLAVPATYIASFGIVFIVCFIIWSVFKDSRSIYPKLCAIVIVIAFCGPIQMANDIYSEEQSSDYDRLLYYEEFVKSDVLLNIGCNEYSSAALYETRHSMGFNDGYWTMYSESYGNGIIFDNIDGSALDDRIYIENDRLFEIWHSGSLTLISKDELPSGLDVYVLSDEKRYADVVNVTHTDSGWFIADCILAA